MGKSSMKLIMAVILTMIVAGCGSGDGENNKVATDGGKKIKVATDAAYAPMEFMDKDKITGFDIEFLEIVMKEAGLEYSVANTGWDPMLQEVKTGTTYGAGISSVSITDERKESYDYSIPYFESTNMILVKEGSPIKNALDLTDKKVAVQVSTTADILMADIMGIDNTNLKRFDSNAVALMELDKGGVDAVVADIAIVREYLKNNPNKKLISILDPANFGSEYYGILFPKGSELKAKLDPAIKTVLENGAYTELYKKWFGEEPNIENVLNAK